MEHPDIIIKRLERKMYKVDRQSKNIMLSLQDKIELKRQVQEIKSELHSKRLSYFNDEYEYNKQEVTR